jgi:hypothetical protein
LRQLLNNPDDPKTPNEILSIATEDSIRIRTAEPIILRNLTVAAKYAYTILRKRWPEFEQALLERADEIGTQKLDGESALKSHYNYDSFGIFQPFYGYVNTHFPNGWPELTQALLEKNQVPMLLARYADYVLESPWPDAEPKILSDLVAAEAYMRSDKINMQHRWPALEEKLITTAHEILNDNLATSVDIVGSVFNYCDQIQSRWSEGERLMIEYVTKAASADSRLAQRWDTCVNYASSIIKDRWPEFEDLMIATATRELTGNERIGGYTTDSRVISRTTIFRYLKLVIKGPWPEAEPFIAQSPMFSLQYAVDILHARFPAGESILVRDTLRKVKHYISLTNVKKSGNTSNIWGVYCSALGISTKEANALKANYASE